MVTWSPGGREADPCALRYRSRVPAGPVLTRRRFLEATGALVAVSCAGAPAPRGGAPAKAVYGGVVTYALETDVIDFDPLRSRARVDRYAMFNIYDSLVAIDASGKIVPALAEKWDISPEGKTYTLTLRSGMKYHDGTDFDAESVKWNLDRYRTTKGSARSGELASIASVDAVDKRTVRLNLKAPYAPLLANLVDRAGMMVSRKAVEVAGEDFTRKAFKAGTGAFILTEALKDDHITIVRNPDWWGADKDGNRLPFLDKITVRPITDGSVRLTNLKTGDAQVANNILGKDVPAVRSDPAFTYQERPGIAFDSIIPNRKAGFTFSEGRYVKAVAMAIDRKEILEKVYFGVGTVGYGAIAPPHFAFDPSFTPFEKPDPEGAKRLVREVGKGPLVFELLTRTGEPQEVQLASLIQAQLAKADIRAEVATLEFAQILKRQTDRAFSGLSLVGWSGRIDPDGNVYNQMYTGAPFNDASYANREVDRLLDEEGAETDQEKRRRILRQAEQIYVVDDPARIWYRFGVSHLLTAKKVQGMEPYPDNVPRFQTVWLGGS